MCVDFDINDIQFELTTTSFITSHQQTGDLDYAAVAAVGGAPAPTPPPVVGRAIPRRPFLFGVVQHTTSHFRIYHVFDSLSTVCSFVRRFRLSVVTHAVRHLPPPLRRCYPSPGCPCCWCNSGSCRSHRGYVNEIKHFDCPVNDRVRDVLNTSSYKINCVQITTPYKADTAVVVGLFCVDRKKKSAAILMFLTTHRKDMTVFVSTRAMTAEAESSYCNPFLLLLSLSA